MTLNSLEVELFLDEHAIYGTTHGTFTCVPMGKFPKIPFHVPWFIRLGRECGKSGNSARAP